MIILTEAVEATDTAAKFCVQNAPETVLKKRINVALLYKDTATGTRTHFTEKP